MRYEIDTRGFVRITASASPTAEDELAVYRKMLADPSFEPGIDILLDNRARSASGGSSHVQKMARLASGARSELAGCRCAIVVSNEVEFGMARMYELMTDGDPLTVRVFRVLEEAETWLAMES